jgi:hypothetical protein
VGLPLQLPLEAVRVWPLCSVPEIVGGEVFVGGAGGGGGALPPTGCVGAEVAVVEPRPFLTVTLSLNV